MNISSTKLRAFPQGLENRHQSSFNSVSDQANQDPQDSVTFSGYGGHTTTGEKIRIGLHSGLGGFVGILPGAGAAACLLQAGADATKERNTASLLNIASAGANIAATIGTYGPQSPAAWASYSFMASGVLSAVASGVAAHNSYTGN